MARNKPWRLFEAGAVMLFAMQALRALLAMLFGRIYDALFDAEGYGALALAGGFFVLMLLMPLLCPREQHKRAHSLRLVAILCALARVPVSLDLPDVRLIAALATLGLASLYVTNLLGGWADVLPVAIGLGVFWDGLMRALGYTFDPSLRPWWVIVQLLLVLGILYVATRASREEKGSEEILSHQAGFGAGLAFGALLFLLASLLALPNAAARWTGATSYPMMTASTLLLSTLLLWPRVARWYLEGMLSGSAWARLLASLLLVAGLTLGYLGRPDISPLSLLEATVALWLLLPVSLQAGRGGVRGGMIAGMILFILLCTAHAFSFTYAYTLPWFKGAGLPTFVIAALLAAAPALLRRARAVTLVTLPKPGLSLTMLLLAWLVAVVASWAPAPRLLKEAQQVRLATYNIHYGYDTEWHLSLEGQAKAIAESGADLVALQEVDTGRLTSYGIDDALWLARRLGMRAIYLPTVEHTTGIALLSRLQVIEHDATLLPSAQEPTGIVRATVLVGGEPLKVHGIWLGLSPEERARQLEAALDFIGEGRAVLAGDMNATPDSPIYAAMGATGFVDPFVTLGIAPPPTDPATAPLKRIDYVWLRGLRPIGAYVSDALASDHRLVVVEAR